MILVSSDDECFIYISFNFSYQIPLLPYCPHLGSRINPLFSKSLNRISIAHTLELISKSFRLQQKPKIKRHQYQALSLNTSLGLITQFHSLTITATSLINISRYSPKRFGHTKVLSPLYCSYRAFSSDHTFLTNKMHTFYYTTQLPSIINLSKIFRSSNGLNP